MWLEIEHLAVNDLKRLIYSTNAIILFSYYNNIHYFNELIILS